MRTAIAAAGPVPFNLPVILKQLGQAGETLLRPGWEIESIDPGGANVFWPASFVDDDAETEDLEMPVTHLMLRSNLTAEYTVSGCPVLTRYPPVSIDDVLTENTILEAVETYRWPARVPQSSWLHWAESSGLQGI